MKNIFKISLVFLTYNLIGGVLWYNNDVVTPIFIMVFALINLFLMDVNNSFLKNYILISGVMTFAFVIALLMKGVYYIGVLQDLGLMIIVSALIYYLKKNYPILKSHKVNFK